MRVTDYSWVFDGWQPPGVKLTGTGWSPCRNVGLPYVEFHAWTDAGCVTVQCDPCSLDQDQDAYAAMVRGDLEKALAKHEKSPTPESDAPTRLARHLRESDPGRFQDGSNVTLYFHDEARALQAFWLIHEVMGGKAFKQSPAEHPYAPCLAVE